MPPPCRRAILLALAGLALACKGRDEPSHVATPTPTVTPAPTPTPRAFTTKAGVSVVDTKPGVAPASESTASTAMKIRFRATDPAGTEVDAGVIEFTPGEGETFPWLEEVAEGMLAGSLRRAEVPADLAAQVLRDATSRTLTLEIERLD